MFTYDQAWENLNSSLVNAVYYDRTNSQMLVRLNEGNQYLYSNASYADAVDIAKSLSPGAAYNKFRKKQRWTGNSQKVNDEQVQARVNESVNVKSTVTSQKPDDTTYKPLDSLVRSSFEVDFEVDGSTFTSTVEASDLVTAVQDVTDKTKALGLKAKLVRAAVK